MKAIVTFGPAEEPIDHVRSLTNHSTGRLGALLTLGLLEAGIEVLALRSIHATYPLEIPEGACVTHRSFSTSEDLWRLLEAIAHGNDNSVGKVDAIFHAAALSDYRVSQIQSASGDYSFSFRKIPTSLGGLTLQLDPAPKLIAHLREWFGQAFLVGWKYELDGPLSAALLKGAEQIEQYDLDASVVNGDAVGQGYYLLLHNRSKQTETSYEHACQKSFLGAHNQSLSSEPLKKTLLLQDNDFAADALVNRTSSIIGGGEKISTSEQLIQNLATLIVSQLSAEVV